MSVLNFWISAEGATEKRIFWKNCFKSTVGCLQTDQIDTGKVEIQICFVLYLTLDLNVQEKIQNNWLDINRQKWAPDTFFKNTKTKSKFYLMQPEHSLRENPVLTELNKQKI